MLRDARKIIYPGDRVECRDGIDTQRVIAEREGCAQKSDPQISGGHGIEIPGNFQKTQELRSQDTQITLVLCF